MTIYGRKDLSWKKSSLLFQNEVIMEIISDTTFSNMFRVKWPDGTVSVDYYNKQRVKEHSIRCALETLNNGVLEYPLEA